jgi:hydrogenase maturation factor
LTLLCQEFGLNPLGVIASGALLLTLSPSDLSSIQKAFKKNSTPPQYHRQGEERASEGLEE